MTLVRTGEVTPIGSVVTAATAGQSFDPLFLPLTRLIFAR